MVKSLSWEVTKGAVKVYCCSHNSHGDHKGTQQGVISCPPLCYAFSFNTYAIILWLIHLFMMIDQYFRIMIISVL